MTLDMNPSLSANACTMGMIVAHVEDSGAGGQMIDPRLRRSQAVCIHLSIPCLCLCEVPLLHIRRTHQGVHAAMLRAGKDNGWPIREHCTACFLASVQYSTLCCVLLHG